MGEVNKLKMELTSLIELQNQYMAGVNQDENQAEEEPEEKAEGTTDLDNLANIPDSNELPKVDTYFVYNGKMFLVDQDKAVWHLKKCSKFQTFSEMNKNNYKSKEANLDAFLKYYQGIKSEKSVIVEPETLPKADKAEPAEDNGEKAEQEASLMISESD